MKPTTEILLKILLAILFFTCLANMPYGYFQLVRFWATITFCLLAFNSNKQGYKTAVVIYICLAILFQPFFKIALGRVIWNIVDVIAAVGLIVFGFAKLFINLHNSKKDKKIQLHHFLKDDLLLSDKTVQKEIKMYNEKNSEGF